MSVNAILVFFLCANRSASAARSGSSRSHSRSRSIQPPRDHPRDHGRDRHEQANGTTGKLAAEAEKELA